MLYPDLRRLAIVRPTGMPLPHGTNNAEAGGSNDPLPPPASRARPGEGDEAPATAQSEALASEDILNSILFALVDGGNFADICRAAARWCFLNKPHMAACDDGVWTQLTRTVFPNARAQHGAHRPVRRADAAQGLVLPPLHAAQEAARPAGGAA